MKRAIKSNLSKINFLLGRNPKVEINSDWRLLIPAKYKAVLLITADFELAWSWRYSKQFSDPYTETVRLGKQERENIPEILQYCNKFNIPITWATVGHLFLSACNKTNGRPHPEMLQPPSYENKYWKFKSDDWYEYDPCSDYKQNPEWYAPDLIDDILNAKVNHEIGCHTFSHIDCRDESCPKELFENEIKTCIELADKKGLKLKTFVHPGHTIGNLESLPSLGFESFQTDPGNILGYPKRYENGLWELKRSYELDYRNDWTEKYHVFRFKRIVDRAIKHNAVCNFWFHPSFSTKFLHGVLPSLFDHINKNKKDIWVTTVGEYVSWLNNRKA